jgi:adenylate cyclase class IV
MDAFDIKVNEIEFKYMADDVSLEKFNEMAESLNPIEYKEVSSWDTYFSGDGLPFEFIRYRQGNTPELTIKIKKKDTNNNSRIEYDVPLSGNTPKKLLSLLVKGFCSAFGFTENFSVHKYCSIYFYEKVDMVFYICYNKSMREIGRFIEIEYRKDVPCSSEEEAMNVVKEFEQHLLKFDISAANRTKRSLWERYRNSNK